jgi:hypothetical protein
MESDDSSPLSQQLPTLPILSQINPVHDLDKKWLATLGT